MHAAGLLLWCMAAGKALPYSDLSTWQLIAMTVEGGDGLPPLAWPPGTPPALQRLAAACMDAAPGARPSAKDVAHMLTKIEG